MDDLISRQAAIKAICEDGTWLESQGCTEITMAERKQRDADILGELPSVEREYKFGEWCTECKEYDQERHCCPRFNAVIRTTLEEVKAERKKGEWIIEDYLNMKVSCGSCGFVLEDWIQGAFYNFCPNCGADMRERKED